MLEYMSAAEITEHAVRGVKRTSRFLNVPRFNTIWNYNPDYMHCELLGVAFQFAELRHSSVGEDYNMLDPTRHKRVSERLYALKTPQHYNRPPQALQPRVYLNAAEGQCWLFYYSLACLEILLPWLYYQNFELFVLALYMLCKKCISKKDVVICT